MPSIIQAGNGTSGGMVTTGATDGILDIKSGSSTGGTTAISIDASQKVSLTVPAINAANPCFSAYQSSTQTISNGLATKLLFQTKEFDVTNAYDTGTSRFQPTIAGYYSVCICVAWAAGTGVSVVYGHKNGAVYKSGNSGSLNSVANLNVASFLVFLNGTTDYVEGAGYQSSGGNLGTSNASQNTYFQAALISRSA